MAKTIVTYCDRHLVDGQEVDATAHQVSIDGKAAEIDLCPECLTEILGPVMNLLTEHGQPVKTESSSERPKVECPVCHKHYKGNKNLRDHLRRTHPDATIEQGTLPLAAMPESSVPDEAKYPCPDCDRTFLRPQAVGAHRARIHGYVSPAAEKNRAYQKKSREKKKGAAA